MSRSLEKRATGKEPTEDVNARTFIILLQWGLGVQVYTAVVDLSAIYIALIAYRSLAY